MKTKPSAAETQLIPYVDATERTAGPRPASIVPTSVIALAIFIASFFLSAFRLPETIDMNSDEATYAVESVSLMQTGMTKWNGAPFFVHPPLFFAIEGAYYRLRGIGQSPLFHRLVDKPYYNGEALLAAGTPITGDDMPNAILSGRYLSVTYGALVAVMLFLLGSAMLGRPLGILAALIFLLDPYSLRRNHFNMLEPLSALFGVLMLYVFWKALRKPPGRQRNLYLVGSGLMFGLALLSKELALLYLVALGVYWLLFRRVRFGDVALPGAVGFALYAFFPIWTAITGHFGIWWTTKTWLFQRLIGVVRDTGLTRPGSSLGRTLNATLLDYWPSFLLLGAAGIFALIFLYFYFRRGLRSASAELLASTIIGGYAFFGVVWVLGGVVNEQFFYFIMPFTLLAVAYGTLGWSQLSRSRAPAQGGATVDGSRNGEAESEPEAGRRPRLLGLPAGFSGALLAAMVVLILYNTGAYVVRYGLSRDDSYRQVEGYLARTLPPGAGVVGRDLLDLYLLPRNKVFSFGGFADTPGTIVPMDIVEKRIPYTILNDQYVYEGYSGANTAYYNWVRANGQPLYKFSGRQWNTYAYYIDLNKVKVPTLSPGSIANGKPAVASSSEDAALYPAQAAFDGKSSTRWSSTASDYQWIYVDLGKPASIGRVELVWEAAFGRDYELQVSNNATDWTTFYSTNKGAGGLETINAKATGRYVRLLLTARATQYGYSLWEIGIYP